MAALYWIRQGSATDEVYSLKIVLINGSPRKGNTYRAAKLFLDEMSKIGEIQCSEYFLPQDLPAFCIGCGSCFDKGEDKCPHAKYTMPILHSMLEAEALLFISPVYVWETTGAMKNFLDHFAHLFLVHRPREEMFSKKAFILSTSNGGLKKAAIKPIQTSLKLWGINRVYSQGFVLHQMSSHAWDAMKEKRKRKIGKMIRKSAKKFHRRVSGKKRWPYLFTRVMFSISRRMIKTQQGRSCDASYWAGKGWIQNNPL